MSLIDSGFITDSVKSHLVELESQRVALEAGIAKEKLNNAAPNFSRDEIVFFLESFRSGDITDASWRIRLVDTFLAAAYLYDDNRLILHLNFSGEKNKATLKIAEQTVNSGEPICSSFAPSGAPKGADLNMAFYFYLGNFVVLSYLRK